MSRNNTGHIPGQHVSGFDMAHYDALPKSVRAALANADQNWNVTQIHKAWRRGVRLNGTVRKFKAAELVEKIRDGDRKAHEISAAEGLVMGGQR